MNVFIITCLILIGFILNSSLGFAQDSLQVSKIRIDLQQSVNNLTRGLDTSDTSNFEVIQQAQQVKKYADLMLNKLRQNSGSLSKEVEYLKSVRHNISLLDQAAEKPAIEAVAIMQDVEEDLKLKVSQGNSMGLASNLIIGVPVTIQTVRNGVEVEGFIVTCNPKRYSSNSTAMFIFNQPSSPTTKVLPPGNYVISVTKNGKHTSRKVSIGERGQEPENIPIDVE